ncbi:ATPase inhibitor A, mitochondrial [Drosophila sulfurigaster albostrigata]|uniref:ATP synthase F1 subunit epsilon n=2 Tax=Drosophila albomicans TaxID=7291 RepID=A0A6P8WS39_DROAB|nr:ATPase inhibitor A, mitochondrial isoform X1 [Drosophila albomicans]XP_060651896.1 ATPase inhibitor A, mitochondrial [Drosophila nasuta]XP_062133247.1 ATPase inhibitor A, mitochondrial [Drosophila sulfurigaster albostrigata]
MFTLRRISQRLNPKQIEQLRMSHVGELGSGAGKGGGGGGSIREAGGSFGKMEAAREEEFFYKQQKEQLKNLKTKTDTKPDANKK